MVTGYRANNPGNIREVGIKWQGRKPSNNPFVIFKSLPYGVRALLIQIRTDLKRGNNTIKRLINKYAPASENDTRAYIRQVSILTGFKPGQQLAPNIDTLKKLAGAISKVETGQALTSDQLQAGANLLTQSRNSRNTIILPLLALAGILIYYSND